MVVIILIFKYSVSLFSNLCKSVPVTKKANRRQIPDQDRLNYGEVKIKETGETNKVSGGCSIFITLLF